MVQLLNILSLPTSLLELADRHRLAERVLREVLALPQAHRKSSSCRRRAARCRPY
jgi:hypothetical protein